MKNYIFLISFIWINILSAQNLFPEKGEVFKDDVVPRIDIILPVDSLAFILAGGNEQSDYHFHATFIFDNQVIRDTIENVGFRLRGNTSRYSNKKSYKVSFNTYQPGRKYYGLEKLNLNGEHNDPSIMRAKTGWDLTHEMKIPASRSNHITLYINGDYFGLYLNVEHVDEEFTNLRFGNKNGNLYKCLWPANMAYLGTDPDLYKLTSGNRRTYDLLTNTAIDDYTDIANLIDILNNTPTADLPCLLEEVFDVESYIKVIAFDILTGNWDGPLYNKNNFYLYNNPATGKFHYIPYDIDNTFGIDWFNIDWASRDIYSWTNENEPHPLYSKILAVDRYRDLFTYYIRLFVETAFDPTTIFPRMDALKAQINGRVLTDSYYPLDYGFSYADFNTAFVDALPHDHTGYGLKPFITTRRFWASQQSDDEVIPPIILSAGNSFPNIDETILFTTKVVNVDFIESVEVCYQINGEGYTCTPLFDNGIDEDTIAADGIYGGSLAAVNEAVLLEYYIKATDNMGLESQYPSCGRKKIFIGLSSAPIFVNEIMASNETTVSDEFDEYDDWLELYYTGNEPLYLGDKYLSDDIENPTKWKFNSTWIYPHQFKIVWLDKDEEQGLFHANFKLSAVGEFVGIFDNASNGYALMDGFDFGEQTADIAYGRIPNGTGALSFIAPTPGFSNVPVAVDDKVKKEVLVAPNPFNDYLKFEFQNEQAHEIQWMLLDIYGKIHLQQKELILAHEFSINTSSLVSGIYFLSIQNKNGDREIHEVVLIK